MEKFQCNTKIVSGPGATATIKELGSRKLFLVADPFFEKNGWAEKIGQLSGAGEVTIFSDVKPDPDVELVARGTAQAKKFGPDTIVALGGGSAMDCAKAIAFFLGGDVRLAAIPTTSGSGAEVTDFAILTYQDRKHPLIDERLRPEVAFLDGNLVQELPKTLVADTGFDVLAHCLEAYAATNAGALSDALARDAFCVTYSNLTASYRGSLSVRQQIHTASAMAGIAFSQAGLGLCHALSHCLGGMFHIPHGRLNAILLPAVIGVNAGGAAHKYASLCKSVGLSSGADTVAVRALRNGLIRLRRDLNMPSTLLEAGVSTRQVWQNVDKIVQGTMDDPCCRTNPVKVEDFMIRRVLEEVTGRV